MKGNDVRPSAQPPEEKIKNIPYKLPEGWRWMRLGEKNYFNVETGGTPSTAVNAYWENGHIKWLTPKDLGRLHSFLIEDTERKITERGLKNSSAKIIPKGSIVISTRAPIGHMAILKADMCFNQGCKGIIFNTDNISSKFVFYFLNINKEALNKLGQGATFKELSKASLEDFLIPLPFKHNLPDLEKQNQIVEKKIETIFKKIEQGEKLRQTALQKTKTAFDAVLNKIFKEAEEGKGWKWVGLGDLSEINPKKIEARELLNKNIKVSFIPMSSLDEKTGDIIDDQKKHIKEVYKGYTYFKEGDVIFAKITPCMENGKCAIAKNLENKTGFGSTEFHVIRPNADIDKKWIWHILRYSKTREDAVKHFIGAVGQKRVPESFLSNLSIPLPFKNNRPDLEKQRQIVDYLDRLQGKIRQLEGLQTIQLQKFRALRESILNKAFKGEL